ncbi:peptidyl-prolyl cis-trans isomerase [Ectobacillus ponti]|uniref:Peptidyl-prolyl cis-trans isomerase n=1 Tax=Ectobacillus ponti TaxID=2961894 RepID=A0AA42BRD1_9BACI|nr:peptidyl-prolyl cis-trans isomerase [Ectobacillus ponti]MCP8970286.1 peptidyl-prolyl cis-trans isomerase [Ectobacillus ponti]
MENILSITGNVRFSITLDPGVWIFDDRKRDLTTYFAERQEEQDELEEYKRKAGAHWDREIREGAVYPPVNKSVSRFEKERVLTGTFCMPLRPFLLNAEAGEDAYEVEIHTEDETITVLLADALHAVLGFSKEGKPLREDGPVHFYFGDGSNEHNPIRRVRSFHVR